MAVRIQKGKINGRFRSYENIEDIKIIQSIKTTNINEIKFNVADICGEIPHFISNTINELVQSHVNQKDITILSGKQFTFLTFTTTK